MSCPKREISCNNHKAHLLKIHICYFHVVPRPPPAPDPGLVIMLSYVFKVIANSKYQMTKKKENFLGACKHTTKSNSL